MTFDPSMSDHKGRGPSSAMQMCKGGHVEVEELLEDSNEPNVCKTSNFIDMHVIKAKTRLQNLKGSQQLDFLLIDWKNFKKGMDFELAMIIGDSVGNLPDAAEIIHPKYFS